MGFVQVLAETVAPCPTLPTNLRHVLTTLYSPVTNNQATDEQGMDSAMQPASVAAGSRNSLPMEPTEHGVELGGGLGQKGEGNTVSNAALVDDAAMTLSAVPDGQSEAVSKTHSLPYSNAVPWTQQTLFSWLLRLLHLPCRG